MSTDKCELYGPGVRLPVVLQPQPDGGSTVRVPDPPEVVTEGNTEAEAPGMAKEAIRMVRGYRLEYGARRLSG
jgi:predicted RNase H-like HicB family nuclease